jgi:hypothetical protein
LTFLFHATSFEDIFTSFDKLFRTYGLHTPQLSPNGIYEQKITTFLEEKAVKGYIKFSLSLFQNLINDMVNHLPDSIKNDIRNEISAKAVKEFDKIFKNYFETSKRLKEMEDDFEELWKAQVEMEELFEERAVGMMKRQFRGLGDILRAKGTGNSVASRSVEDVLAVGKAWEMGCKVSEKSVMMLPILKGDDLDLEIVTSFKSTENFVVGQSETVLAKVDNGSIFSTFPLISENCKNSFFPYKFLFPYIFSSSKFPTIS